MDRKGSPVILSLRSPFRSLFLIAERTLGEWKNSRSLSVRMRLEFIVNGPGVISTCGCFLSTVCFCIWSEQSVKKQVKNRPSMCDTRYSMLVICKFCIGRCYFLISLNMGELFTVIFHKFGSQYVVMYWIKFWISGVKKKSSWIGTVKHPKKIKTFIFNIVVNRIQCAQWI